MNELDTLAKRRGIQLQIEETYEALAVATKQGVDPAALCAKLLELKAQQNKLESDAPPSVIIDRKLLEEALDLLETAPARVRDGIKKALGR